MSPFVRMAAAALTASFLFSGASIARPLWPVSRDLRAAPEGLQAGLFDAEGRACVKQCIDDTLPCDPPSYKSADGRCSHEWR